MKPKVNFQEKMDKPQCPYRTKRAFDGYLCCGRNAGHRGPHVSVYELSWEWKTAEEWGDTVKATKRKTSR